MVRPGPQPESLCAVSRRAIFETSPASLPPSPKGQTRRPRQHR